LVALGVPFWPVFKSIESVSFDAPVKLSEPVPVRLIVLPAGSVVVTPLVKLATPVLVVIVPPEPVAGVFAKAGLTPRRYLAELRTDDASEYTLGQEVTAGVFASGQHVDVTGRSKGKGFAGVMKRHGFKGLSSSHGTQRKHRSPGSIGACATPGRVFKGVRMAGRMGGMRTTVQSLTVHAVDTERGLLLIKGAVPGPRGRVVLVRSAVRNHSEHGGAA